LLEQLYAGEVGLALVSAKQLGLPVAAAGLQVGSLAPRLTTHKPGKNDVKKRATASRALHFFEGEGRVLTSIQLKRSYVKRRRATLPASAPPPIPSGVGFDYALGNGTATKWAPSAV
jgi:hypothetical protein